MYTYSVTAARAQFSELIRNSKEHVVQITDRNRPSVAVMDWDEYESLLETLEVLSDSEAMEDIRQSRKEYAQGKTKSWAELRKDLGLK
ncbi:phd_YefM [bacterium BMS3Bbin04]|nr:phd_YefM [bacterium BMS3Bbin04]